MYKIIGADGKEYGPVTAEQLRQWLGEGRVNFQTKVRLDDQAEWQALGALPEFAAERAANTFSPPLLPPGVAAPKTSGLAIASLVLGILGLFTCAVTAFVGLVLGIVSLVKIKNSQGRLSGMGLAAAGTAVSAICILLLPVLAAMVLPALARAKDKAQSINCMNNVKQLSLAVRIYAGDHNDQLPPAAGWCDALLANVGSPQVFCCPAEPGSRCAYALNDKLGGKRLAEVDPQTVMFFEAAGGWNQSGGPEAVLTPSRHRSVLLVGFADGHVEAVSASRVSGLRWDP
jgi:prepilin-type processing-associated H-X9-DG protein